MSKGGAREGAGRKAGSVNKRNAEVVAAALASGMTPLEYMLEVLRDEDADAGRRSWAAEKAAPYLHPRPVALEPTLTIDLPDTTTADGVGKAIDAVLAAVASGEIAPSQGQGLVALIEARRKAIETEELGARIAALEQAMAK